MMGGGKAVVNSVKELAIDDTPSEMYDDYVPSICSNANLDDFHAVSSP